MKTCGSLRQSTMTENNRAKFLINGVGNKHIKGKPQSSTLSYSSLLLGAVQTKNTLKITLRFKLDSSVTCANYVLLQVTYVSEIVLKELRVARARPLLDKRARSRNL